MAGIGSKAAIGLVGIRVGSDPAPGGFGKITAQWGAAGFDDGALT